MARAEWREKKVFGENASQSAVKLVKSSVSATALHGAHGFRVKCNFSLNINSQRAVYIHLFVALSRTT